MRSLLICTAHQMYAGDQIEENEIGGACSTYGGGGRGVCRVSVGKPEGKKPLGRRRNRWEDNIMMGIQEVRLGGMDWIKVAQNRYRWRALVNAVMNLRFP